MRCGTRENHFPMTVCNIIIKCRKSALKQNTNNLQNAAPKIHPCLYLSSGERTQRYGREQQGK